MLDTGDQRLNLFSRPAAHPLALATALLPIRQAAHGRGLPPSRPAAATRLRAGRHVDPVSRRHHQLHPANHGPSDLWTARPTRLPARSAPTAEFAWDTET